MCPHSVLAAGNEAGIRNATTKPVIGSLAYACCCVVSSGWRENQWNQWLCESIYHHTSLALDGSIDPSMSSTTTSLCCAPHCVGGGTAVWHRQGASTHDAMADEHLHHFLFFSQTPLFFLADALVLQAAAAWRQASIGYTPWPCPYPGLDAGAINHSESWIDWFSRAPHLSHPLHLHFTHSSRRAHRMQPHQQQPPRGPLPSSPQRTTRRGPAAEAGRGGESDILSVTTAFSLGVHGPTRTVWAPWTRAPFCPHSHPSHCSIQGLPHGHEAALQPSVGARAATAAAAPVG